MIDNTAQTFGDYLGRMRRSRSVTLGAVARRSGINKSTLSRWEAGTHTPRMTELKQVLDTLGASAAEEVAALRLIDTPRAVVAVRLQDGAAIPLSLGDLLYGLRQRTGQSQTEVARAVGVSRPLYSHWETDSGRPNTAQLHAAGFALGASAEEIAILTTHRFASAPAVETRDALMAHYQSFYDIGADYRESVYAPKLFALIAHCGRLLRAGKADVGDLALLLTDYAGSLDTWYDDASRSVPYHRRALALAAQSHFPLHFHMAGLAKFLINPRTNPRPLRERLDAALALKKRLPQDIGKAYLLSSVARGLAEEYPDEALRLADEYCTLAQSDADEYPCRLRDRGNLLRKCGRDAESVDFLSNLVPQDNYRAGLRQLDMAQGLVKLGAKTQVQTCITEARRILPDSSFAVVATTIRDLEHAIE